MDLIDTPVSIGDITLPALHAPRGAEVGRGPLDTLTADAITQKYRDTQPDQVYSAEQIGKSIR